jgi:hypothetical protein
MWADPTCTALVDSATIAAVISTSKSSPGDAQLCIVDEMPGWNDEM